MGDLKFGDFCRATCSAPARYFGHGMCLWVSSMCNDLMVTEAAEATGGEGRFPQGDDDMLRAAAAGYIAGTLKERAK